MEFILSLFQGCHMNATPLPVHDSAVTDADSTNILGVQSRVELRELAMQSLETHPAFRWRLDMWGIQIEVHGDTLILNGRLPSWYLKQLLQETLRHVDGVGSVMNRVVVVKPSDKPSHGQALDQ